MIKSHPKQKSNNLPTKNSSIRKNMNQKKSIIRMRNNFNLKIRKNLHLMQYHRYNQKSNKKMLRKQQIKLSANIHRPPRPSINSKKIKICPLPNQNLYKANFSISIAISKTKNSKLPNSPQNQKDAPAIRSLKQLKLNVSQPSLVKEKKGSK